MLGKYFIAVFGPKVSLQEHSDKCSHSIEGNQNRRVSKISEPQNTTAVMYSVYNENTTAMTR